MRAVLQDGEVAATFDFFNTGHGDRSWMTCILAPLYSIMGLVTLIQLARIHFLVHIDKWTMQKGFQTLNVVICICRAATLFAYGPLHDASKNGVTILAIDFASVLFFTTYTLLVLFWAEIVHLAMDLSGSCSPLTVFVATNAGAYVSAALFWSLCAYDETLSVGRRASSVMLAMLDIFAAIAFAYYGHKLLNLLKLSASRSTILVNKIREVSFVAAISVMCFASRAFIQILSTCKEVGLTYSESGFLDVIFYGLTEILAMGSILLLLSRTPRVCTLRADQCGTPSEGPSSRFYDPYHESPLTTPIIPHHPLEF